MKKSEVLKLVENYSYIRYVIDREEKLIRTYNIANKIRYGERKDKKSYTKKQVLDILYNITRGDFNYTNIEKDDKTDNNQTEPEETR